MRDDEQERGKGDRVRHFRDGAEPPIAKANRSPKNGNQDEGGAGYAQQAGRRVARNALKKCEQGNFENDQPQRQQPGDTSVPIAQQQSGAHTDRQHMSSRSPGARPPLLHRKTETAVAAEPFECGDRMEELSDRQRGEGNGQKQRPTALRPDADIPQQHRCQRAGQRDTGIEDGVKDRASDLPGQDCGGTCRENRQGKQCVDAEVQPFGGPAWCIGSQHPIIPCQDKYICLKSQFYCSIFVIYASVQ